MTWFNKTVYSKHISPFHYGRHTSFPVYPIGQPAVTKVLGGLTRRLGY